MEHFRHLGLALVASGSLVIGMTSPVAALEPADGLDTGPPVVCPNPTEDGGSCLGPLEAGTYRTTVFETPFTFTVPEGWANYEDLPGNVLLVPPGSDILGVDANTSDFVGVYQGVAVEDSNCQPRPEAGVGTSAEAMAAALASRPGIIVSDPVPVEVGGLSGLVIDIVTDSSSDAGCHLPDFPFPIVPLFIGMGPASLEHSQWGDGFTTRLYLLDRGDTNVVIEVSDVASAPGTADEYQSVLDTIVFSTS